MPRTAVVALSLVLGFGLISWSLVADAQRIPRIGYLIETPLSEPPSPERKAFLDTLRERGFEEGRNLVIEYRSADGATELLPELVAELVKARVDLIFTVSPGPVVAAMKVAPAIPIVFVSGIDPVQLGFAESLARPGKNVTGITLIGTDLGPKRLQLVRELLPHAKRIAVLQTDHPGKEQVWHRIREAGTNLGFALEAFDAPSTAELTGQLDLIARARPDALLVVDSNITIAARSIIADFGLAQRLPSVMGFTGYAAAGGLIAYGPSVPEAFRRGALYVDKILKGAKPGELPVEQPTQLELVINLNTAKALGIAIPQAMLVRADGVIQ
jgi:putative tryptophan/tyrosine transport system substrate-binding protein